MKFSFVRLIAAATTTIFLVGVLPTQGIAAGAKTALQEKRSKTMKSLGGAMRTIKKAGSMAPTVGAAKNILAVAGQLGAMFPKGSGGPATRSKPEIWTNMADFKAKLEGMKMAATALVAATGSGNLGTVKQAFGGVGQTCRGCHKPYRVPKKRH